MTAHLCSRPSASPQEQRGNWFASPVQLGLVVRYLGLSANPTRICGAAVSGATKELYEPGSPPPGPWRSRFAVSAGGQTNHTFFVVPDFLFLSRVTASRLHALVLTGLDSVLGGTTDLQRQRHSRHVSGRPASVSHGSPVIQSQRACSVSTCDSISDSILNELLHTRDHPRHATLFLL